MIEFEAVLHEVEGLEAVELDRWIRARWVLPERTDGGYYFHEIDIARIHLIAELRHDMLINDEAMPVVLNLLDQVYALRNRMKSLAAAVDRLPTDLQELFRTHLKD
jgi:chaperone modulatory protein CbpM